jgi:hypothetical protein
LDSGFLLPTDLPWPDSGLTDSGGGREAFRSCVDVHANGLPSGIYAIDPAGDGIGYEVHCENDLSGGGWQLVSATAQSTSGSIFGGSICLDPSLECSGRIPDAQRPALPPSLLFATVDGADWVELSNLGAAGGGGLYDFLVGDRTLSPDSCGVGNDNFCWNAAASFPDAGLAVTSWGLSGASNPRFTTINRAWYQRGGLWFGKDGGGGDDHVLSFGYDAYCGTAGGLDISRSGTQGIGTQVCGAPGAVYFR